MNTTATESVLYYWSFGSAEFDEGRWELRVGEAVVDLARKPLDVLQYLLHHAGEAVTKEELLATVWEGRIVVEAVLTNAIAKLRKALGDDEQRLISTLPKVGYRLEGTVHRRVVEHVPEASRLSAGDLVPRRPNWSLQEALARHGDGEVWRARHIKTGQPRVFKFSLDGRRLANLKREVTVGRLLEQSLGPRADLVRVIDWGFEQAPYFIEFEDGGMSLDHWDGFDALALETRLALFVEAADTVAAAHGVGVLHKDLKPANLLVYGEEDNWHLRVADFGSSQMLEPDMLDQLGITRMGFTQTQSISPESGTPLYMAPEVLAGQSPTIKSDVYAFGVTLYQMIVGDFRRPLAAGWENDIPDPLLRADIAAAANGDPTRRPESVATLAEGIRNLEQRRQKATLEVAVRERIAEGEKRLEKLRARRPWVIAAGVLLVAGTIFSSVLWQRSDRQRDLAVQQAKRADAVLQYLSNDLIRSVAVGGKGYEKDPTIREMVGYASATVDDNFSNDAATRGSLHAAIGASWDALADTQRSVEHYRKAWRDYVQAFGESDERTLLTEYELVRQLAKETKYDEALKLLDAADKLAGVRLQQHGNLALRAAMSRGMYFYQHAELEKAEHQLNRAQKLLSQAIPGEQAIKGRIQLFMAEIYGRQGKAQEAEALMRAALADPSVTSESLRNNYRVVLSRALSLQRKYAEALVFAEAAATSSEKLLGADASATLVDYQAVGKMQLATGDCAKALETRRRTWKLGVQRYGMINSDTLLDGDFLANNEIKCGDKQAGEALKEQVFANMEKYFPDRDYLQPMRFYRARGLMQQKKYREALALLERIDSAKLAAAASSPGAKFHVEALRGECMLALGDTTQARVLLAGAIDGFNKQGQNLEAPTIVHYRELLKKAGG